MPTMNASTSSPPNFSALLSGKEAFYRQANYLEHTSLELAQSNALPPSYTWIDKSISALKECLCKPFTYPMSCLSALAGRLVLLPASDNQITMLAPKMRQATDLSGDWKYKRLTVLVDSMQVDVVLMGTSSTLGNGRWLSRLGGNGEFYEMELGYSDEVKELITATNSNAILFNYPAVGASTGSPNRPAMIKAYRAVLTFLEDKQKGLGAKEVIFYAHSIGNGVLCEALESQELHADIKYLFVRSRTFSSLSRTAEEIGLKILRSKILGYLVRGLDWNFNCAPSSKQLKMPEIILQTASVVGYEELQDSSLLIDDGIIPAKASLAKALLDDPTCPRANKLFLGVPEAHNDPLSDIPTLATLINHLLDENP